ncbi:MAG: RagB/SusD family nutrient uptake outer membrane protein [Chitinophaga rupis]
MQDQSIEIAAYATSSLQYAAQAAARVSQRHLLYPIPTKEMSLNHSMTQNPGW